MKVDIYGYNDALDTEDVLKTELWGDELYSQNFNSIFDSDDIELDETFHTI